MAIKNAIFFSVSEKGKPHKIKLRTRVVSSSNLQR